ncbi:DHHC palmitoyltransferase [Babesia microti strain RI]|uniref:Palmitoyltransferase n=1 Tax=Babesia microti (strain RI) TaxID=1133968 RepID=I7IFS6_BABMR|nr:DHHC palmitoyltransferase [Babesia microti strain RI]CCF73036.1 DHHC palmitoyltransferase [Babesia microti strain RI]|eukprot:XP_012647645.1 DHHC palmitoyltransferase [Babesia microti strain RI]
MDNIVKDRPAHTSAKKKFSCFIYIAIFIIVFMYLGTVGIVLPPYRPFTQFETINFYIFHIIFALFVCSFIKSSKTDPGSVPQNWGFYMGDETKRKRYCKVCNVWKPERTHHCSACKRCVLNMDHHCPWINNCIGFYNRKYFIQMLCYALSCLSIVVLQGFIYLINESFYGFEHPPDVFPYNIIDTTGLQAFCYIYTCMMIFVGITLTIALVPFVKFHFCLVIKNSTTIERLDESNPELKVYDIGIGGNLQQVFGVNPLCWFAPCNLPLNKPVGDGVRWPIHYYHPLADGV